MSLYPELCLVCWIRNHSTGSLRILAVPYTGDALRVYYKDKLLVRPSLHMACPVVRMPAMTMLMTMRVWLAQTDNWYSGYTSEQGGAVVGLSYLAAENPGLLGKND